MAGRLPSSGWYALAVLFLLSGLVLGVWGLGGGALRVARFPASLTVLPSPGQGVLRIDRQGQYAIYYQSTDGHLPPTLSVHLVSRQTDEPVPLEPAEQENMTYTNGNMGGRMMWSANVPRPGEYKVSVGTFPAGEPLTGSVVFGPRPQLVRQVTRMLVGLLGGATLVLMGVVAFGITLVIRTRELRRLAELKAKKNVPGVPPPRTPPSMN
jgi:hypothetical protein